MTTLHTPGPWMFDCEPGRVCGFVAEEREDGRGLADLRPSQRIRHADKRRSDEFVLSEEDVANARLMAAAPTLLARLRDALAVLETLDYEQHENLANLEAGVRAAIALATGEDGELPTRAYTVELRKSVCVTVDATSIADAKAQAKALPGDLDGTWFKAEPEVVGVEPHA